MERFVLVAAGGAAGAAARYAISLGANRWFGPGQVWGTLAVNVVGSLLMGVLIGALAARGEDGERWRLLLGVGVLGGFTTFSAFSLEAYGLIERRVWGEAALYVAASVVLSLAALAAGVALARSAA